jgi:signal peptidase I
MEATLFWIGCGLGGYAFLLRRFFLVPGFMERGILKNLLHIFFWGTVGALVGFVFSASMDLHGPSPKWPISGAVIGVLWALFQSLTQGRRTEGTTQLLTEDLEWVETSFSAILLAAVIMYAVVQAFKIPSGSMEDTLLIGDHLFVNKFIYGVRVPFTDHRIVKMRDVRRGDVIVFQAPDSATFSSDPRERGAHKDFIKRAIGVPGDKIQVKDKHVYVNGQMLAEPYTVYRDPMVYPAEHLGLPAKDYQKYWEDGHFNQLRREEIGDNFGPIQVPPGDYFVMGDNRDGSFDSRFWGPLPNRLLKGRAWIVYWPPKRLKVIR